MRLWARLALVLATVALASVALVGLLVGTLAPRQAEADAQDRLHREALLHAEVVGRWVADQQAHAEAWTQVFPGRLSEMDDTLRQGFLAAVYRGTPSAVSVVMVDGDAQLVVPAVFTTRDDGVRPASDADRVQALVERLPLTEAMASGSAVGTPWRPDGAMLPSVPVAVLAAQGPGDGDVLVLGLELQLMAAADMVVDRDDADHAVALLGAGGEPLVGGEHRLLDTELLGQLLYKDADFKYGARAEQAVGSIVPVPYTPWSAVVVEPAWQVRSTARSIRFSVAAAAAVSAMLATVLALVMATQLSQPVTRLRDAALALAQGQRTPTETTERRDELGELGRAFEHMADQLQAQRAAIEGFNEELQERVDERTRELSEAQDELVRSSQLAAVAEVGAGLAHELNNPLASVLGLTQVMRAQRPDDALLEDLESEAARCRDVVRTMLRFSAGEVDPESAPVIDLHGVLREVAGLVSGAFQHRGVALELAIVGTHESLRGRGSRAAGEDVLLPVRMDPVVATRMLAQVLKALRAGLEPGATLTVSTLEDDDVCLCFRADQALASSDARRDDLRASGLELWVAREQVDRFGGRLEQADTADGSTRWTLRLPRAGGTA